MNTVAIVQARVGSTRLPGKVLYELAGMPMIVFMLRRAARAESVERVVLATGLGRENDALAAVAADAGFSVFRGPEEDVLARYAMAAVEFEAGTVVRLTGDCPLADPEIIDMVVRARIDAGADYATNVKPPTWPDGLDVSAFSREILDAAHAEAKLPSEREHVVTWMWKNTPLEGGERFSAVNVSASEDLSAQRWTVDEAGDYLFMRGLVDELGAESAMLAGCDEIARFISGHPGLSELNKHYIRDEGLAKSLARDREEAQGQGEGRS